MKSSATGPEDFNTKITGTLVFFKKNESNLGSVSCIKKLYFIKFTL